MRISRENALIGLLLLLLLAAVGLAAARDAQPAPPPLLSTSARPDGARALRLWLETQGVRVLNGSRRQFAPPDGARVALVLAPSQPILPAERDRLLEWTRQGGVLLIAGSAEALLRPLDVTREPRVWAPRRLTPVGTLLRGPLTPAPLTLGPDAYLKVARDDFVTLLAIDDRPLIVAFPLEEGRVIVSATAAIFTNDGLRQPGYAALTRNLIALSGETGPVWFDDWHHGESETAEDPGAGGFTTWLRTAPAGQAVLLAGAIVFGVLLWQGRSFGRPLALPNSRPRRAPLEYIVAVANLNRRAGNRRAALDDLRLRLKRHLGRRYSLDPALPDEEYLHALADVQTGLDTAAVADLFTQLRTAVGEQEFVRAAAAAARWMACDANAPPSPQEQPHA